MPYKDLDTRRKKSAERMKKWRSNPVNANKRKEYYQKTKQRFSEQSKEYYKKNKEHILKRTKEYQKLNPNVKKKSQQKAKELGKGIIKGKRERENLAPSYVQAQIRKNRSSKTVQEKEAEILIYRLKKQIKKTD